MKKLSLKVETLATLSEDRAQEVNGGILATGTITTITAPSHIFTCVSCPSHTGCPTKQF